MPILIVTGARKGLGLAMARHYLDKGWRVAGCSREASSLVHPGYTHTCLDVADEVAVTAFVRETARREGGLDALINNAGAASMNALLLTPGATFRRMFETNLAGSFHFLREAAKVMMPRRSGRIVNLTSVAVPMRLEGEAAYACAKAGVEELTRVAARELGPFGITVNAVGPGPVQTDLLAGVPESKIQTLLDRQAIHRLATPEDVLAVVDFFLDKRSAMVTGQVVYLGGVG